MMRALSLAHEAVLNCYKAYLTGESPSEIDINAKLDEMLHIAQVHQIESMVYHVLRKTEFFKKASNETRLQWRGIVLQRTYLQECKNKFIESVYMAIEEAGIQAIVLKGITLREVYGNPEYRHSSDEDIWIRAEDIMACDAILKKHGFSCSLANTLTNTDLSAIHDIIYYNAPMDMTIELQFNPIGVDIWKRREINNEILSMRDRHTKRIIGNVEYRCLDVTDNVFFVFAHMAKHFLSQGASIRMCSDVGLLCRNYQTIIDWEILRKRLEMHSLLGLFASVITLNRNILGIDCGCPYGDEKSDIQPELLYDIMSGGAYGTYTKEREVSAVLTEYEMNKHGTVPNRKLFRCLFPDYSIMQQYHPELRERRWLLPVYWVKRLFRIAVTPAIRNRYIRGYIEGERRTKLFRKLGI